MKNKIILFLILKHKNLHTQTLKSYDNFEEKTRPWVLNIQVKNIFVLHFEVQNVLMFFLVWIEKDLSSTGKNPPKLPKLPIHHFAGLVCNKCSGFIIPKCILPYYTAIF